MTGDYPKDLITFAEFARHIKVTPQAVSEAIKSGRLTVFEPAPKTRRLSLALACREWDENADLSKRIGPTVRESRNADLANISYQDARKAREFYNAELHRLEFEKRTGELAEVAEVKRHAFNIARSLRDALLSIPERISSELAAETDVHAVRSMLITELRQATRALDAES